MTRTRFCGVVRLVGPAVLIQLAVSCSGPGEASQRSATPRTEDRATIRLADCSRAAGLDVVQVGGGADADYIIESIGMGGAWLDYDNDGDPDLYLAQGATNDAPRDGPSDRLLRNDGDADGDGIPTFTDVTDEAGLGDRRWSFGVSTADYDNDGDTDIYLLNWGRNRLYRNNGDGTFTDVAEAAGVADPRWSTGAVWGDTDRDGDLDLYVANYIVFDFDRYPMRGESPDGNEPPCVWKNLEVYCGPRNLEPEHDAFFRNEGDPDGDGIPTFVEVSAHDGDVQVPAPEDFRDLFLAPRAGHQQHALLTLRQQQLVRGHAHFPLRDRIEIEIDPGSGAARHFER